jgi:hypothetical protein
MNLGLALGLAISGAVLFVAPSAAADASPPPSTPLTTAPGASPAPVPLYGPGVSPGPPPGAYYPPPGGYYAPPGGYYAPPSTYVLPRAMERRSVGAMVGGIVAVTGGAVMLFSVVFVSLAADTCVLGTISAPSACPNRTGTEIGLTVGSIAALALGIPLIIYGAKKVPVGGAPIAGTLPAWMGAPGGPGWRWHF